jgi:TetR/AcrR family transcriptional regulator, transcriptional repressor for nem operon
VAVRSLLFLDRSFQKCHDLAMGRAKEFDEEQALDAAVEVFREHGFEGTSAVMLVDGMKIGRQSLYDTFGDKWQLYLAALRRYCRTETRAHVITLKGESKAFDGIRAAVERVVREARQGCLGVNSICEFGGKQPEVSEIHVAAERSLRPAFLERIREAQLVGDISPDLEPDSVMDFLSASFAGIRIAARGGASEERLQALGRLALRALR